MKTDRDLYEVLGISADASQDEIRRAFRDAALANHPDRFQSYVQKLRATGRMQEINHAYSILRDPGRRTIYDASRPRRLPDDYDDGNRTAPLEPATDPVYQSDHGDRWWLVAWVLGSGIVGVLYAESLGTVSLLEYIGILVGSFFFTPMILTMLAVVIALPLFVFAGAFTDSFKQRSRGKSRGRIQTIRDLTVRSLGLGLLIYLLVKAFSIGVQAELVYLLLLGGIGSVAGELAAMLAYLLRRRSVESKTTALLGPEATIRP